MARVPEGIRIRQERKRQKITQTALANDLGISASYLNLIEHNKRSISGSLLNKMARVLAVDLNDLAGYEDARLIQDLEDLSSDPLFRDLQMEEHGARNIIGRDPGWGRAFLRLHVSYIEATKMLVSLSNRFSRDPFLVEMSHEILTQITTIRSLSEIVSEFDDLTEETRRRYTSVVARESSALSTAAKTFFAFMDEVDTTARTTTPAGEVEDFIIDHHNYFPRLEGAAEALRTRVEVYGGTIDEALQNYLAEIHGITLGRPGSEGESVRNLKPGVHAHTRIDYRQTGKHLFFQQWQPAETVRFLIAQFIFEREHQDILGEVTAEGRLTSDDARGRAGRAMARYAAGAFIYPYEPFLKTAMAARYDIQILQRRLGGSFEQICHRLTTLHRPDSLGIPFIYLRTDPAGNISKRFSLPNMHLPRYGGACPLWAIYRAFMSPGRIISQRVRMPNKQEFLFVARTVKKSADAFGSSEKIYSVMIGCDAVYADRLVYGDGNDGSRASLITEAGVNCRLCPRLKCDHRAYAPILPVAN